MALVFWRLPVAEDYFFKLKFLCRKLPGGKWKLGMYPSRSAMVDDIESKRNKSTGGCQWIFWGNSFTNEFSTELQINVFCRTWGHWKLIVLIRHTEQVAKLVSSLPTSVLEFMVDEMFFSWNDTHLLSSALKQ